MSRPRSPEEFARYYQRGEIAEHYDRDRSRTLKHLVVREVERAFFCGHAPKGGSALELGVGTGEIAAAFAQRGPLLGIDSSAAMLALARARVPGIRLKELSMFDIETLGEHFATIYTSRVFLHLDKDDLITMLHRCAGCLQSGGLLLFDLQRPNPTKWVLDRLQPHKVFNYRYTRRDIADAVAREPRLRLKKAIALEHMALLGPAALLPAPQRAGAITTWLVRGDQRLASIAFSANRWGVVCERI